VALAPCEGWEAQGHGHPLQGAGGTGSVADHVQGSDPGMEICKLAAKKGCSKYVSD